MRSVVLDTSTMLSAVVSPNGARRKFLVLLAYGRMSSYARFGLEEQALLEQEMKRAGGAMGGMSVQSFVAQAEHAKSRLAERLPAMAPDDLGLVVSKPLLDEYENRLAAKGPLMDNSFTAADAERRRLEIAHLASGVAPPFDPEQIPLHTEGRDRNDDPIIHTSLTGGAELIVSDDSKHIALSVDAPTEYRDQDTGAYARAYRFGPFISDHVETSNFDLDDVDGRLYAFAASLMTPP